MLKRYGVRFTYLQGKREQSVLGSYTDTYNIAKNQGEKCLEYIFSIIENAGWNHEPNGYATFVIKALKDMWIEHPLDRERTHVFLSNKFRKMDPCLFSSAAKTTYPLRDRRVSCALYTEDMVCNELHIERKIYNDTVPNRQ